MAQGQIHACVYLLTTPVLRILGGAETGRYLWLPESQLSKKPSHKGISYGGKE